MRIEEKNGKFEVADFTEIEAYKIALKIEEDGIDFYKNLCASLKENAKIKESINFLLGEEKKHVNFFQKSIFKLREKQVDRSEDNDLLSSMDYAIFKPYQEIAELNKILLNPAQAMKLGLIIENNSLRFYESCKNNITDATVCRHLELIIEEERRHKQILEEILSNL